MHDRLLPSKIDVSRLSVHRQYSRKPPDGSAYVQSGTPELRDGVFGEKPARVRARASQSLKRDGLVQRGRDLPSDSSWKAKARRAATLLRSRDRDRVDAPALVSFATSSDRRLRRQHGAPDRRLRPVGECECETRGGGDSRVAKAPCRCRSRRRRHQDGDAIKTANASGESSKPDREASPGNGRRKWKKETGYHRRPRVDNSFFLFERLFGGRLRSRDRRDRETEARLGCNILDRALRRRAPNAEIGTDTAVKSDIRGDVLVDVVSCNRAAA